jgi:hypothetical protein
MKLLCLEQLKPFRSLRDSTISSDIGENYYVSGNEIYIEPTSCTFEPVVVWFIDKNKTIIHSSSVPQQEFIKKREYISCCLINGKILVKDSIEDIKSKIKRW